MDRLLQRALHGARLACFNAVRTLARATICDLARETAGESRGDRNDARKWSIVTGSSSGYFNSLLNRIENKITTTTTTPDGATKCGIDATKCGIHAPKCGIDAARFGIGAARHPTDAENCSIDGAKCPTFGRIPPTFGRISPTFGRQCAIDAAERLTHAEKLRISAAGPGIDANAAIFSTAGDATEPGVAVARAAGHSPSTRMAGGVAPAFVVT